MMVSNLDTINRNAINAAHNVTGEQLRAAMDAVSHSQGTDKVQYTINMFQTFVIGGTHETTGDPIDAQKPPGWQSCEHFHPRPNEQPIPRDIFGNIDFETWLRGPDGTSKPKTKADTGSLDVPALIAGQKQSKKKPVDSAAFPSFVPETSAEGAISDEVGAILASMKLDSHDPPRKTKAKRSCRPMDHDANAKVSPPYKSPVHKLSDCDQVQLLFGRYLNALCPTGDGQNYKRSEIDLNQYLMNCDGQFKVDLEGNFIASAFDIRLSEDLVLEAWLDKIDGEQSLLAKINLDDVVKVHDGHLTMSDAILW